jgi:hypothetical protein
MAFSSFSLSVASTHFSTPLARHSALKTPLQYVTFYCGNNRPCINTPFKSRARREHYLKLLSLGGKEAKKI